MSATRYSEDIAGDACNYSWSARFDHTTGGYVGISQNGERVLLSPAQVKAFQKFLAETPSENQK